MQKENVKLTENSTGKSQHLTGRDVLLENIHLGGTEQKTSGKFNYCMTQVLYDNKPFVILERAKMKIFSFNKKTFSVGLSIDEKNKDYFEKIEEKISNLYDDLEINLIKPTNDYLKIYAKLYASNGKIYNYIYTFRLVENGRKRIVDPKDYMGIPFVGQIVLKIAKTYDGSCVSLICEAREVLIEEVFVPPSIFDLINILTQKNILMQINFFPRKKLLKVFVIFFRTFFWN